MRNSWNSMAGLAACGFLAVVLLPDAGWARPKGKTYLLCKCTCRAEDELGKLHYGSSNGISYTTDSDSCDSFHKCTVGRLEGIATDCLGTEKQGLTSGVTPQGVLERNPTAPGGVRGTTSGTVLQQRQPVAVTPAPADKTGQPGEARD